MSLSDKVTAAKKACYKLSLDDHKAVLAFVKSVMWFAFLGGVIASCALISVVCLFVHLFNLCLHH